MNFLCAASPPGNLRHYFDRTSKDDVSIINLTAAEGIGSVIYYSQGIAPWL
jgi:hypothetical protein